MSFPFVLVDKYLPGIPTNAVYSDNYRGGMLGTEYLIGQGHRNIGILSEAKSKTSSADERFRGYLEAAQKHQLVINPDQWLIGIRDTYNNEEEIEALVRSWIERHQEITAVFSFNRNLSIFIAKVAREMGRRVPEELSILAFDNPGLHDLDGYYFSFIQQDTAAMGEQAVKLLAKAMREEAVCESIVTPISLYEGRTVQNLSLMN